MPASGTYRDRQDPIPSGWTAGDIPDQAGRTVLVTGANSGLGFLTSLHLARKGAHVVMTARDERRGIAAVEAIRRDGVRGHVELRLLDLADLDSVRRFADAFDRSDLPLDVLVNNAGVMMPPRTLTRQGHELQFGVNHLAHFLLTLRLLHRLRRSPDGRVVTVTSDLHKRGRIHFDDLTGERHYGRVAFYAQSKFANALFALELDRRLRAARLPIKSLLAHPGYSATNLQLSGPTGMLNLFMRIGNRFLAQSAEAGALNQLYAAAGPGLEGGEFVGPDGKNEMRGYPKLVQPAESARDAYVARKLWALSEDLTAARILPAGQTVGVEA